MKQKSCSICGNMFTGWGNNPQPFDGESCCDDCNDRFVVPVRMVLGRSYDNKYILVLLQTIAELGSVMSQVSKESVRLVPINKLRLVENGENGASDGPEPA